MVFTTKASHQKRNGCSASSSNASDDVNGMPLPILIIIYKPLQLPRNPRRELERQQFIPERPHDPRHAVFQCYQRKRKEKWAISTVIEEQEKQTYHQQHPQAPPQLSQPQPQPPTTFPPPRSASPPIPPHWAPYTSPRFPLGTPQSQRGKTTALRGYAGCRAGRLRSGLRLGRRMLGVLRLFSEKSFSIIEQDRK